MKIKELLYEGTWQAPQTKDQAQILYNIMNNPLPANRASRILYDVIGDDDLFDQIAEVEEKDGPDADVRYLVALTLKDWLSAMDFDKQPSDFEGDDRANFGWREPWDPQGVAILKRLIKKHAP